MKNLLTILLILISFSVFGQKKMMKKAELAFAHYEKGEKYEALLIFKELVKDYPKSEQYGRNLYNIPTIYQEIDSTKMAIEWFMKVLNDKNLDDSEKDHSRGIFETNTNFKHYAAMNIGVIHYNNNNYSDALNFYKLADIKYPYYNTSGTDLKLNKIKLASNISDCYDKLNQTDSAIVVLLPHALTESPKASNYASQKIISLVKKYERENSFFKELDKSINNLEIIDKGIRLNFYGIDVKVYPYFNEKLTKKHLKNTLFYKEINKAGNDG
ncbi:tol-pal system YbgF family protein [Bernardetia sp. OM2101]|uniref:tetratricopeptide repeat protein n=1 Tax=Bernardetia sp. OM2101 TaxID=3344876 RepID=UPI0035CF887B